MVSYGFRGVTIGRVLAEIKSTPMPRSRLLISTVGLLAALGCGGRTNGTNAGASTGSSGTNGGASAGTASGGFSGTTGSTTSGDGMCKIVQPSNYDQSCAVDTDCVLVDPGTTSCSPDCRCGGMATINASAQAQYDADLKQALALAGPNVVGCGCPPPPETVAHCHGGTCQLDPWMPRPDCGACSNFCVDGVCTDAAPAVSCHAVGHGLSDCGASKESCCTSLKVAGGTYYRTYANSGSGPTGEADPATVSGFRLDKYLVTVGRFREFVGVWNGGAGGLPSEGSGRHTHLNGGKGLASVGDDAGAAYEPGWVASDKGNIAPTNVNLVDACASAWATWTPSVVNNENLPINCVNWYEAYAFCIWDGGFLPSEAEWEYAAAGGSQQREFAWGSTAPATSNKYAIYGCNYPSGSGSCTNTVADIAPVGTATLGAGLWGQLDMAGGIDQWTLDWYSTYVAPSTDSVQLTVFANGYGRVIRGGAFESPTTSLLPPHRNNSTFRSSGIGIRCARSPQ